MKNLRLFFWLTIICFSFSLFMQAQQWQTAYPGNMYLYPNTALLSIGNGSLFPEKLTINEPGSINPFGVRVNNSIKLIILNNGNVGIGTSSPQELLHLNGSIRGDQSGALRINSGNGYIDIGAKNTANAHLVTDRNRFYFNKEIWVNSGKIGSYDENLSLHAAGSTIMSLTTGGLVGVGNTNPLYKLDVNGDINFTGQLMQNGTPVEFSTGGGDSYWDAATGGIYYNGGNVGIGTANPNSKLEVAGLVYSTTGGFKLPDGTVIDEADDLGTGSGNSYWDAVTGGINFAGGNVGIGGEPSCSLDVFGSIKVRGNAFFEDEINLYNEINMHGPNTSSDWHRGILFDIMKVMQAGIGIQGTGWSMNRMYLGFGTFPYTSVAGINILPNGNVGINIVEPKYKLHIKLDENKSIYNGLHPQFDGPFFELRNTIEESHTYDVCKLLIGITDNSNYNSLNQGMALIDGEYLEGLAIMPSSNGIYINNIGNVGIGCIDPQTKLSVNGTITASRIDVVETVPGCDYVFEEEYNLLSLKDVEEFVKTHKHLPEVPSAEEFKENGYSVGEMDDLLLRKIEELTLYMIELKKENQELEKRLNDLENE